MIYSVIFFVMVISLCSAEVAAADPRNSNATHIRQLPPDLPKPSARRPAGGAPGSPERPADIGIKACGAFRRLVFCTDGKPASSAGVGAVDLGDVALEGLAEVVAHALLAVGDTVPAEKPTEE
jgi:hypothetical protein